MWSIFLTTLLIHAAVSIPPLQMRGVECTCDGNICTNSNCYLTAKRPNLNVSTFELFVAKPQSNVFIRTQFYNNFDGTYVPVGPPFWEDFCNVPTTRSRSYAYVVLLAQMKPYAENFVCPFKNNISLANFPPLAVLFPPFITTSNYKLMFSFGCTKTNKTFHTFSMLFYTTWV